MLPGLGSLRADAWQLQAQRAEHGGRTPEQLVRGKHLYAPCQQQVIQGVVYPYVCVFEPSEPPRNLGSREMAPAEGGGGWKGRGHPSISGHTMLRRSPEGAGPALGVAPAHTGSTRVEGWQQGMSMATGSSAQHRMGDSSQVAVVGR